MRNLYNKLPHPVKSILVNIYGYFLERKRYNKEFYNILNHYLEVDKKEECFLNIDKITGMVKESLYYSIKNNEDFYSLPLINKEVVKNNYDRLINKKHLDSYLSTSGTTGSGFKYPVSREFIYHQWALFWKFRILHGMNMNTWCAYLIGKALLNKDKKSPPYWIKSYTTRQLLLSLPHLNKNTVKLYLQQIKNEKIKWIHAYPSALNLLAGLILDCKLQDFVQSLNLALITTSSEVLYLYQKKNIENIFGCKVKQLYGLTEGVANIFECEYSFLHVDESFSYVEFIKDENYEGHYKIIGSQYYNKAFPLIRYDTGDSVLLYDEDVKCGCGRNSRIVKEIIGREQDYLILDDNSKRVRIGSIIFRELFNIKKAQIIQHVKGQAEFYIIKGPNYSYNDEKFLIREIKTYLGSDFKYKIIYTDKLVESGNGKVPLIINGIKQETNLAAIQKD